MDEQVERFVFLHTLYISLLFGINNRSNLQPKKKNISKPSTLKLLYKFVFRSRLIDLLIFM